MQINKSLRQRAKRKKGHPDHGNDKNLTSEPRLAPYIEGYTTENMPLYLAATLVFRASTNAIYVAGVHSLRVPCDCSVGKLCKATRFN